MQNLSYATTTVRRGLRPGCGAAQPAHQGWGGKTMINYLLYFISLLLKVLQIVL